MVRTLPAAIAISALFLLGPPAGAQAEGQTSAPQEGSPQGSPAPAPGAKPAGSAAAGGEIADEIGPTRPADLSYGMGLQLRWVSVPAWMLNLFTKNNMPLSSWGTGIAFFRRKGNFDLVGSFNYQNMSPPDGNWLGKNHDAATETDLVQFRGLALYAVDVSFVWHQMFNNWIGMHYGAGIGIGIVGGQILRTSDGSGCTDANAGDVSQCHPVGVSCPNGVCNEQQLAATTGTAAIDGPATPHRFSESSVPPVLPIVNVVLGIDFRLPQVRGWEATIQGGFYDAFFLGGAVGYTF